MSVDHARTPVHGRWNVSPTTRTTIRTRRRRSRVALAALKTTEHCGVGEDNLSTIMDSGAEEHVITRADWQRLGGPQLQPGKLRFA